MFKFYDKEHRYELDGEVLPSVSEISRFVSREIYDNDIDKFTLDNAKNRGTAVHKATEMLDTVGTCDISSDYMPYINAYIQFRKDFKIKEYKYIEKPLYLNTEQYRYAGTLDRVYVVDDDFILAVKKHCKIDISKFKNEYCIIDIKTSSQVKKQLAQIQLPAYSILLEKYTQKPLFILHLKKDGKYKLTFYDDDLKLFISCYRLHCALMKKKRKKL